MLSSSRSLIAKGLTFDITSKCQSVVVRHGGGGGAPGGRPTLSWKERRQLGLDKKNKNFKVQPSGFLTKEEIDTIIDVERGDMMVSLGELTSFESPTGIDNNNNKQFKINQLFGSKKGYGILQERFKKQRFSHSRVFGTVSKRVPKEVRESVRNELS